MRSLLSLSFVVALAACAVDPTSGDETADQAITAASAPPAPAPIRMNHVQALGTHNSYHKPRPLFPGDLDYGFEPLDVQLEKQGVRSFELDLHLDLGRFNVYHALNDPLTTCLRFTDCLKKLKGWSDEHRTHPPIMVMLEAKEEAADEDPEHYSKVLEEEILDVWPRERLVTPDLVKGDAPTLRDAVTKRGWPVLDEVRGRAMFFLYASDEHRRRYTHGGKDLAGRLAFVGGDRDKPYASVLMMDKPQGNEAAIRDAVKAGFIVRTRADDALKEPKKGDASRLKAALASGAQIVSTDFPARVSGIPYVAAIPGGRPVRCNPVNAPEGCGPEDIDR